MSLSDKIEALVPEVTDIRHDLHRHPELGYEEHRTSAVVQRHLKDWGIEHVGGLAKGTGVLAYLPSTTDLASAPTVALRADMDALPILEDTGVPYSSEHAGVMHACGHDGHTSVLLGAAKILSQSERPNHVLLLFQPAEEGGAGGEAMCEDGVLAGRVLGNRADRIFGLHGNPYIELGQVTTRSGPLLAAASQFEVTVHGKGSHAAYPHKGIDPIVVAAHIITAFQTFPSRAVDPLDSAVITVGKLDAGFAHNVIPDKATILGTHRALNDAVNQLGKEQVERISSKVAEAFGATTSIRWLTKYPVTINEPESAEIVRQTARAAFGEAGYHEEKNPSMGGEDFSFYGQHVPAAFFFVGLRPATMESFPNLHSAQFNFNDDALAIGMRMMCELASRDDIR